jgi:hypothetical protein
VTKTTVRSSVGRANTGCAWAIAYLRAHAAPGYSFQCPGNAFGHQAMTCSHVAGMCPGTSVIAIARVCYASVANEAWNSRHPNGPIDPYGHC